MPNTRGFGKKANSALNNYIWFVFTIGFKNFSYFKASYVFNTIGSNTFFQKGHQLNMASQDWEAAT